MENYLRGVAKTAIGYHDLYVDTRRKAELIFKEMQRQMKLNKQLIDSKNELVREINHILGPKKWYQFWRKRRTV